MRSGPGGYGGSLVQAASVAAAAAPRRVRRRTRGMPGTLASRGYRRKPPRTQLARYMQIGPDGGSGPIHVISSGAAVHLVAVGRLYREGTGVQCDLVQVLPRAEVGVLLAVPRDPAARRGRVGAHLEVLV